MKANIAGGVATIEKAEVRTPLHRIAIAGVAQFASGELDLSGKAEAPAQTAAQAAEQAAATTFRIDGPWSAPLVTPTTAPIPE